MILLPFFAFLSGVVTILSPCILPVLPIVLSGSVGGKRKPLGVVLGFAASFSLFTLILSTLVQVLQIPPNTMRIVALVIIIGFGLILVIPRLQQQFELFASRLVKKKQGKPQNGFLGGIMVGTSLGLIWTPCVGPIMASVIGLAISQQVDGGAVIIILSYALGTSLPMLGIMLGGRKLINHFPRLMTNTGKIQRAFGIIMILVGLSIGFGLDRQFQTFILRIFPNYGTALTSFENSDFINKALDRRSDQNDKDRNAMGAISEKSLSWDNPPQKGRLGDFGNAPELITQGKWFNTQGESITMDDLSGKVVIVDFWTYSCVNCVRTLPYLRSWYDTYHELGLEIIGVHSPEFAFERDEKNVQRAMEELGVTWPVVLDNSFDQWRAYNNRFWPAHYFIDAQGRIRYFHFGEGEYENSEKVIRALLEEAGQNVSRRTELKAGLEKGKGIESNTPEIYLGYERLQGFLSQTNMEKDTPISYNSSAIPGTGEWDLKGEWIIRKDFIQVEETGILELGFHGKHVFLVIEPLDKEGSIQVELDGDKLEPLYPRESRLYQLVDLSETGEHLLRMQVKGRLRFYAFTFG